MTRPRISFWRCAVALASLLGCTALGFYGMEKFPEGWPLAVGGILAGIVASGFILLDGVAENDSE